MRSRPFARLRARLASLAWLLLLLALVGCGSGDVGGAPPDDGGGDEIIDPPYSPYLVNSLEDVADPAEDVTTLRSALADAPSGQPITFVPRLDGETIPLTLIGAEHSVLKGEVMGIKDEPSGPVSYLVGYFERDYGRSALYARKNVVIDASALDSGITIQWAGGAESDARVLAVYGDLTLTNVRVTGGRSVTEDISTSAPAATSTGVTIPEQPWTLARGAGVAVWGVARVEDCILYDNHCVGDFDSSRDRGAFGGGLYADLAFMEDCIVCGNTVLGAGAAGGGVFSVGGAEATVGNSTIERCSISGNLIRGMFAYGAGVYSDGGGIGNDQILVLENCTIARNVAAPAPTLPPFLLAMGYWRGGGVYMSNGYLHMQACTVVENEVSGYARTDDPGKPNLAGGVAATIGNAHAVEETVIAHSILAGNLVHELGPGGAVVTTYPHDVFTGSVRYFRSMGYNRIGVLDFRQILAPVGEVDWLSLARRRFPQQGDAVDVVVGDVLDLVSGVTTAPGLLSAGVGAGTPAPLAYLPQGTALDQVPAASYEVPEIFAEYALAPGGTDDFLAITLARIEAYYGLAGFAAAFTADFEAYLATVDIDDATAGLQPYEDPGGLPVLTLADTHWYGPAVTWPKLLVNYPWIEFWHRLDPALAAESIPGMGPEGLGDAAWDALFDSGPLVENPDFEMLVLDVQRGPVERRTLDQRSLPRPPAAPCDIGAIEAP